MLCDESPEDFDEEEDRVLAARDAVTGAPSAAQPGGQWDAFTWEGYATVKGVCRGTLLLPGEAYALPPRCGCQDPNWELLHLGRRFAAVRGDGCVYLLPRAAAREGKWEQPPCGGCAFFESERVAFHRDYCILERGGTIHLVTWRGVARWRRLAPGCVMHMLAEGGVLYVSVHAPAYEAGQLSSDKIHVYRFSLPPEIE